MNRPKHQNQYLKTYVILDILGRKNPSINALENTDKVLNNPILSADAKLDYILKNVLYIKKTTDDKIKTAINIINNTLKIQSFYKKCTKCKTKVQKSFFTQSKNICDSCKNEACNDFF